MHRLSNRLLIVLITFILGISAVGGWLYYEKSRPPQIISSNGRWERNYFKAINEITNLAGLESLREIGLKSDDIEIRIWNGFALQPIEAVIFERKDGKWSAAYIKTDANANSDWKVELKEFKDLNPPKSGWESFWKQIDERGLMTLPDPTDESCLYATLDVSSYVVEINHNKIYRTYKYPVGIERCGSNAKLMEEIGEIIALEFDSGTEPCKRAEWFACEKIRQKNKNKRIDSNNKGL